MAERDLPESGFRAREIYCINQSYEVVPPDEVETPESGERSLNFAWDWRYAEDTGEDEGVVEVRIRLEVGPTPAAREVASADLIGRFELFGEQSVNLRDFVMGPAPAILMPYMRERLSSLTGAGPFGAYHLPIVNVSKLMKGMDYEQSTGFQQKKEIQEEVAAEEPE